MPPKPVNEPLVSLLSDIVDLGPCQCAECRSYCQARPCWPTPAEVHALIEAGYAHQLMLDWWLDAEGIKFYVICGAVQGYEGKLAPKRLPGVCTFYTREGLCSLHILGLKPLQGRLIHHTHPFETVKHIRTMIAHAWNSPEGRAAIALWREDTGVEGWPDENHK